MKIKTRFNIVQGIAILSFVAASYDFMTVNFVIFVIAISSAFAGVFSASSENQGFFWMSIALGVMSFAFLFTDGSYRENIEHALNTCYSSGEENARLCDEIYDNLNPYPFNYTVR